MLKGKPVSCTTPDAVSWRDVLDVCPTARMGTWDSQHILSACTHRYTHSIPSQHTRKQTCEQHSQTKQPLSCKKQYTSRVQAGVTEDTGTTHRATQLLSRTWLVTLVALSHGLAPVLGDCACTARPAFVGRIVTAQRASGAVVLVSLVQYCPIVERDAVVRCGIAVAHAVAVGVAGLALCLGLGRGRFGPHSCGFGQHRPVLAALQASRAEARPFGWVADDLFYALEASRVDALVVVGVDVVACTHGNAADHI